MSTKAAVSGSFGPGAGSQRNSPQAGSVELRQVGPGAGVVRGGMVVTGPWTTVVAGPPVGASTTVVAGTDPTVVAGGAAVVTGRSSASRSVDGSPSAATVTSSAP